MRIKSSFSLASFSLASFSLASFSLASFSPAPFDLLTCSAPALAPFDVDGFDVTRSGTNAGAALGRGLYVTSKLEKALIYAKRMPYNGAIFELRVELGQCYTVNANDSNRQNWQEMGYDSSWAAAGIMGEREEYCIKDPRPPRVVIQHIFLGHTGEANSAGYWVAQGKFRKSLRYLV
jgi:hypothetical protein